MEQDLCLENLVTEPGVTPITQIEQVSDDQSNSIRWLWVSLLQEKG